MAGDEVFRGMVGLAREQVDCHLDGARLLVFPAYSHHVVGVIVVVVVLLTLDLLSRI